MDFCFSLASEDSSLCVCFNTNPKGLLELYRDIFCRPREKKKKGLQEKNHHHLRHHGKCDLHEALQAVYSIVFLFFSVCLEHIVDII